MTWSAAATHFHRHSPAPNAFKMLKAELLPENGSSVLQHWDYREFNKMWPWALTIVANIQTNKAIFTSVMTLCSNPPILCQHAQIPVAISSVNRRLCCCAQGQKRQFVWYRIKLWIFNGFFLHKFFSHSPSRFSFQNCFPRCSHSGGKYSGHTLLSANL